MGIEPKLLVNKAARASWKFVLDYHKEHGKVPGALTVTENTGFPFGPPVDDNVTAKYVAQKLFERAEGRALEYGLSKAYEALEEGQQAASVAEVFALADHLRKKKALQLQVKTLGEVAPEVLKRYEDIKAGVMGIKFPWPIMNGMTMGLWPKTLTCFVARPGVGKTWTAVNIAMHARYVENKRVLIVSPEIDAVEMGERLISMKGQFAYGSMVEGTLGFMVEKHLKALVTDLEGGQEGDDIWILDDEDKISPEFIEQAVAAVEPDIVIIDSIYMLRVSEGKIKKGAGSKGGRYDRILETIDWMRSFARRSGLPLVCISQLSREGKVKKGAIEAVKAGRGTGGLEDALAMSDTLLWDVHNLFAIWQDVDMRMDKQLMFIPLKVRRAAKISGLVIKWDMEMMDFSEIGTKVISSNKPDGSDFKDDGYDEAVPY